ncbi:MAG TPA: MBL fold metallo-hydrolase [Smithellaceae bacterium]|jgi:glyoxylase-like metal-dependent hydrolase (beta-lactamase superfamily II)|nr:MBL fold metallo-hydrolase [Smithellaceae bacterium]HQK28357.1 MBL fold metallo-hydrolase [Smithellaceae bacterium]
MEDRQFGRLRFICGENYGKYPFNHSVYIKGSEARIIIDPACSLEKLTRLRDQEGVDMIWLSHWHEDHFHYMYLFDGAQLWISETDFPPLTDVEIYLNWYGIDDAKIRTYWNKLVHEEFNYQPRTSANFFPINEEADIGGIRVQTIATPGHTPGYLSFFFPEEEVLFIGDYDLTPFGPWYGDAASSIEETIESIRLLKKIPAKKWIACHEKGLFEENPGRLWDDYENIIYAREKRILDIVSGKPSTLEEIASAWPVYGRPRKPLEFFEPNERVLDKKHLERLQKNGLVVKEGDKYRKI